MKKRLLLALVALVLLTIGLGVVWKTHHPKANTRVATPSVVLSSVRVSDAPIVVQATATLVANQSTAISSKIGGYIKTINITEGSFVKAGDVLLTLENTKEEQAYRSAQAEAKLAQSTYQRYFKLRQTGVISKQDIDQYEAKYAQTMAAEKSAERAVNDMKLVAPFDGYLGASSVSIGNLVSVGQNLLTLTDTNQLRVQYTLPSRYASLIKVGQAVEVVQDDLSKETYHATVSFVAPFVDAQTQTIEVHANLDNRAQKLKPGQSVNVTQTLGVAKHALLVPKSAVIVNINGSYVYQVKNERVVMMPVTTGEQYEQSYIILKGLKADDQIITQGQYAVKPGQTVRVAGA